MAKQMSASMKDPGVQVLRISRASDEWEPKDGVTLVNGNVLTKSAVKYLEEFGITVMDEARKVADADETVEMLSAELLKTTTDALVAEQDKSRALEYLVRAYEAMCPAYVRDVARKAADAGLRMLALHAVRQVVVDAQQDAGGGYSAQQTRAGG